MQKHHLLVVAFGILFLFIIQSAGTLVESIYILDLMNSNLDEKSAGGVVFLCAIAPASRLQKGSASTGMDSFRLVAHLPWADSVPQHRWTVTYSCPSGTRMISFGITSTKR